MFGLFFDLIRTFQAGTVEMKWAGALSFLTSMASNAMPIGTGNDAILKWYFRFHWSVR